MYGCNGPYLVVQCLLRNYYINCWLGNCFLLYLIYIFFLAVTAAADAFQAWRILEDLTNRVDLILTEVHIPGLSGIGLLCKIMSHRMCKNIPVISEFISYITF